MDDPLSNPLATNYDPEASLDDGSCTFDFDFFRVTSGCSSKGYVRGQGDVWDFVCTDDTPPCTVSEGGRCVGRPEGYGPSEECTITVVGTGGGVLGPCGVFDTAGVDRGDYVTLPGGARIGDSDCAVGAALAARDALSWASDGVHQGTVCEGCYDNGCAAKGTCGLRHSHDGLGGGWQLCFVQ